MTAAQVQFKEFWNKMDKFLTDVELRFDANFTLNSEQNVSISPTKPT